jgi:chromosome segregation protein
LRVIEIDLARSTEQFEQMSQNAASEQATADAAASALAKVAERIGTLTRQTQADRERQFQLVGRLARLQSDTETLHAEQERLRRELSRKLSEGERTQQQHDALGHVLGELSRTDADLQWQLNGARQNLAEHLSYREDLKKKADALQVELETLRESRSSLRGRVDVLEGLERNLEGIDSGVREVLARMKQGHPVLSTVLAGLVADLISAPRDVAPLIDVALGELAQRFVVTDSHRFDELLASLADLPGRVGFVPLHLELAPPRPSEGLSVWNADAYVRVDHPDLTELPRRLLGNVLLVADLATARTLQRELPGYRILTRQGEILEADGSFAVGPLQAGAGILSRKSELRELREQVTQLDREVERLETQQLAHRRQAEALEAPIRALETEITALSGEAGSLRDRIRDQRQVQQQLAGMLDLIRREASQIEGEVRSSEAAFEATRVQMLDAKRDEEDLKEQLDRADAELGTLQRDRELRQAENLAAQVALSRVREQLNGLRKRRDDLESELKQRRIDGVNLGAMERSTRNRLAESTLTMLRASAMAAHAYSTKEENERTIRVLSADREALRKVREEQDLRLRQARAAWSEQKDRSHAHELLVRDLSNRRESLESRIREEYGLELSQLAAPAEPATGTEADPIPLQISVEDTPDADEVQSEIDDLRKKIAKLGSVNLEALDELAQIEKRETDLQTQHDDLAQSQAKLQAIIEQINGDSRRLFLDLMNVVRGHFLDLFRKLFGGGTADIVLEENADPLESGIDVIARPPGKELRSISLLSGGERTMTAIALLLALFRSRPSPFCLLDEVDAALDEANTARLSMAIREFLDRSQFIVITHKKRTMATADVLYGISMQESGVSKQVAVRFEDWPDDPSPVAAVSEGEAGKAGYGGS